MKLRLKGDSIRLRLGPREVERLVQDGSVTETVRFGGGSASLRYTLMVSADARGISTTFDGGRLQVSLPTADARRWAASTEQVALTANQDLGDDQRLSILIEKDFECLHGEKTDDAFPRPEQGGEAAPLTGLADR